LKRAGIQRRLEPGSRGIATVRSRYEETASGNCTGLRTLSLCVLVICKVSRSAMALQLSVITSCVLNVNKFNIQSKTPSRVTQNRESNETSSRACDKSINSKRNETGIIKTSTGCSSPWGEIFVCARRQPRRSLRHLCRF
jgi:hypothetical protein